MSGPAAPRPPKRSSKPIASERLGAFLRSLPDHALLDRLVRGRVWIPLLGVMLVGIVAMQVELLKLNASTGRSIELISSLQSHNESLRVDVASASNPNRIERIATGMGMTMPGPEAITFLSARSATAQRALRGIRPPDVAAFEAALPADSATANPPTTSAPPTTRTAQANTTARNPTTTTPQTNTTAQTTSTSQTTTTSQANTTPQTTTTTATVP